MSRKAFVELVEGFCSLAGLSEPERAVAGETVMMDGVGFTLVQSDEVDPSLISIYAEFGKIPLQLEARVCKLLLEANLYLYIEKGPIFTLSPDQKSVICAERRMLGQTTPKDLRDLLVRLAAKANEWRKNYFLDTKAQAPLAHVGKPGWLTHKPSEVLAATSRKP